MDFSSDSQNEKETNKNNFFIINENQDEVVFPTAFKKVFLETKQITEDDELNDEVNGQIYFQNDNKFIQNEENQTYVSSVEIKAFQNPIKGVFHLFHLGTQ